MGERRERKVEDRIVACRIERVFPLLLLLHLFPAELGKGANVNTGPVDFEWLLHVTALCEFPSCRATTSFASRLVIKITEGVGGGIYARCYAQIYTRANPIGIRVESTTKRNDGASYRILPRNSRASRSNSSLLPPFSFLRRVLFSIFILASRDFSTCN